MALGGRLQKPYFRLTEITAPSRQLALRVRGAYGSCQS
jgi:hypothetical protein